MPGDWLLGKMNSQLVGLDGSTECDQPPVGVKSGLKLDHMLRIEDPSESVGNVERCAGDVAFGLGDMLFVGIEEDREA